jgi:hypothetical protein
MISISIACGLVICLFQLNVGRLVVRINPAIESPVERE